MGDNAILNDILRVGFSRSDFNVIDNPVMAAPYEVDHFFEVQHVVSLLLQNHLIDPNSWYGEQTGYFMDLASFVNEHRNLYQISRAVNQAKKNIPLNQYRTNATITTYLAYRVMKGGQLVTVGSQVREMATQMRTRKTPYAKLTKAVGERLCTVMGW